MHQSQDARIAIIGAGVSGLTAGLELKKRGYKNVVIFEKMDRVGGKTFSCAYKGAHFDLGSMLFSRPSEISELADHYHVSYAPFTTKDFYYSNREYLNPVAYAHRSFSWGEMALSLYGLHKVITSNHLRGAGYGDIDPELFQDFRTYLKTHHLEAAAMAFQPAITGLGYGYFEATPALYGLKVMASMMDASLMRSLLTSGSRVCFFPGGWAELWERVAADLDVRTGVKISSIQRLPDRAVQIFVDGTMEIFDTLLITTPLNHLSEYLDLTKEESDLFHKIRSQRMISTLVEGSVPLPTAFLADNAVPERNGHVLGIEAYVPETHCAVLFQTVPENMSKEDACRLLTEDLKDLGCEVQKIVLQKEWEYFYHVTSQDLADGFYRTLNALQGERNTFYLGSILNYETIGHCQQFAKHLVEMYF